MARALLTAIGKFPDAQGAFCLLRSCSRWAEVLCSCRTVLLDSQPSRLRTADTDKRAALGLRRRLASLGNARPLGGARCQVRR